MSRIRETGKGTNLNGKAVNEGMFKAETKSENHASLAGQPQQISQHMESELDKMNPSHPYVQAVHGHYQLNSIATRVRSIHPDATAFTISIDTSEVEDEYEDEPGYYLGKIITDKGEVDFDSSYEELEDDMLGISWQEEATYEASAMRHVFTGELRVNIDQALDIPEYLKNPELKDQPAIPTEIQSEWGYEKASSLAHAEHRRRAALNSPIFTNPYNTPEATERVIAEINAQAETRIGELSAAGVSR